MTWKVVPLCNKQLRDINPQDTLHNGHFRKCNTYKSGGGYDKFPQIAEKRLGNNVSNQFIVQLYGCSLHCPYCYVTKDGYLGDYVLYSSEELVDICISEGLEIFHLMGGSPALYIENWHKIIELLPKYEVFHSDLLLIEKEYNTDCLISIKSNNSLYAVNIKGVTPEDFYLNTSKKFNNKLFWSNLDKVVNSGINFYLTFTNPNKNYLDEFINGLVKKYGDVILEDSFVIELIDYEALK